ncbi:hypothetical protein P170DRAFT_420863 [Aspergillus steynii IBT 23096]|uniref:Pectate lyase n=1 Tax=Aspergillus steynii IBT 23096 TaxID=1392250 RepID=A0A2I2GMI6_9EURO|nr:uncharacterized protein P170DRAFT_420863 [Aspergillus steynii IBT 23096]PLB54087.1 hypothetical protein P170DRAFT_420863 [Aspergillus steynii IBT 23096]
MKCLLLIFLGFLTGSHAAAIGEFENSTKTFDPEHPEEIVAGDYVFSKKGTPITLPIQSDRSNRLPRGCMNVTRIGDGATVASRSIASARRALAVGPATVVLIVVSRVLASLLWHAFDVV